MRICNDCLKLRYKRSDITTTKRLGSSHTLKLGNLTFMHIHRQYLGHQVTTRRQNAGRKYSRDTIFKGQSENFEIFVTKRTFVCILGHFEKMTVSVTTMDQPKIPCGLHFMPNSPLVVFSRQINKPMPLRIRLQFDATALLRKEERKKSHGRRRIPETYENHKVPERVTTDL